MRAAKGSRGWTDGYSPSSVVGQLAAKSSAVVPPPSLNTALIFSPVQKPPCRGWNSRKVCPSGLIRSAYKSPVKLCVMPSCTSMEAIVSGSVICTSAITRLESTGEMGSGREGALRLMHCRSVVVKLRGADHSPLPQALLARTRQKKVLPPASGSSKV